MVFHDPAQMAKLNEITARFMTEEIRSRLQEASAEIAILDAPTLFESGMQTICDDLLCITAPEEACIQRIMLRDHISEEDAALRLNSQRPESFFIENCNLHLHNDGDLRSFRSFACVLLTAIKKGEI
jgi:dephospho-CoA kinase